MRSRWMAAAMVMAVLALVCWLGGGALAATLTASRDTPERTGELVSLNVASGAVVYAGGMVAVSNGVAYPAADLTGYTVVGRAELTVDNSGAAYKAANPVPARRGVFRWANGGSFTAAHLGQFAYVSDDQTVTTAASATADIVAGLIVDIDTSGVWVDTYAVPAQGAASLAALTVAGNAAVGGTLAVTGVATLPQLGGTTVTVTNNAAVAGTLAVTGAATAASVTASGQVKGATVALDDDGHFAVVDSTNLVWISGDGAVTNSLTTWAVE